METKVPYYRLSEDVFMTYCFLDNIPIMMSVVERFSNKNDTCYAFTTWHFSSEKRKINDLKMVVNVIEQKIKKFTILVNCAEDYKLLKSVGISTYFIHNNAFLDENIFRINHDETVKYNAIYTAQILPYKRLELTRLIPNKCIITFYNNNTKNDENYRKLIIEMLRMESFLNFQNQLLPYQVSQEINKAKCGLILSEVEGGNYATTEYLLCGIPVITTENKGGRDYFLDKKNSFTVKPDEQDILSVVNHIGNFYRLRNVRDNIRNDCLVRMLEQRNKFYEIIKEKHNIEKIKFINKLIEWV